MDPQTILAELIAFPSVSTTSNKEISHYIRHFLESRGFQTEWLEYNDLQGVTKCCVVARKGSGSGGFAYFGHTDVVPADDWFDSSHGPWHACQREGRIYGRGACDMKGSLACFLAAADHFVNVPLRRPLYAVFTADEEIGYGGAIEVQRRSTIYRQLVAGETVGIIGEPTCLEVVYAHKGSYGFVATSRGKAAHSSTREGINANLAMIPFLQEMKAIHDECHSDRQWQDPRFDPPTISWNIGINDFTRATNITAPQSVCTVYFRPMPGQNPDSLLQRAAEAAARCGIEFQVTAKFLPFYRDPNSTFFQDLLQLCNRQTPCTVCYGTDACIFQEIKHLAIVGPGNIAQAHTQDEWISVDQLYAATDVYQRLIERYCL